MFQSRRFSLATSTGTSPRKVGKRNEGAMQASYHSEISCNQALWSESLPPKISKRNKAAESQVSSAVPKGSVYRCSEMGPM